MLDSDLARIYEIETKYLKRAVRSNPKRFPADFMFELTKEEVKNLRCRFCTSSLRPGFEASNNAPSRCKFCTSSFESLGGGAHGGERYAPFAFTESGIGMLSSVINSDRAIEVNVQIMRIIRQLRNQQGLPQSNPDRRLDSLENRFEAFERRLDKLADYLCGEASSANRLPETERVKVIQHAVAEHWGITVEDLKSADRSQSFTLPRHVAIYLVRNQLGLSLNEIGRHFGGRDHATILSALRKIERLTNIGNRIDAITSSIQ
jgi:hypothetical protein